MSDSPSFLPTRPSLEQLRKQAKELCRDARAKNPAAIARLRAHVAQPTRQAWLESTTLADAQFVLAREYGFESWPRLKRHVEAVERPPSSIQVRALSGNLRHFEGGYKVEPQANGGRIVLRWVGSIIPDMPLFMTPQVYIKVPLETAYQSAWEAVPAFWRDVLDGTSA